MKGAALAGLLLAASAQAQVPQARTDELGRLPYEQLERRRTELHLGAVRTVRDASGDVDRHTENVVAFAGVSRGFGERLELGVVLPYLLAGDVTTVQPGGGILTESSSGIADPTFRARYALARSAAGLALSVGLLATPDWGGRRRGGAPTGSAEPFVVLGMPLGAVTQAYLRYGYAYRSGDTQDAHRISLGGRRTLGPGYGMLGWIGYTRATAGDAAAGEGLWRFTAGGFVSMPDALQLVLWAGVSRAGEREAAGRLEDASGRAMGLSLIRRF